MTLINNSQDSFKAIRIFSAESSIGKCANTLLKRFKICFYGWSISTRNISRRKKFWNGLAIGASTSFAPLNPATSHTLRIELPIRFYLPIKINTIENWWKGSPSIMKSTNSNKIIYWKVIFILLKTDVSEDLWHA